MELERLVELMAGICYAGAAGADLVLSLAALRPASFLGFSLCLYQTNNQEQKLLDLTKERQITSRSLYILEKTEKETPSAMPNTYSKLRYRTHRLEWNRILGYGSFLYT